MYQRYFGMNQKGRYSLAHKAGYIGLAGTVIVFLSFLYNLFESGNVLYFYCNLGVFIFFAVLWISLIGTTKRELAVSIPKSNFILFVGFTVLAYNLMYGVKMYLAFQPSVFSIEFLTILLYLFLDLFSSVLLIINGTKSYREISGRYTRIYKRIALKRNITCFFGLIAGVLLGMLIVIQM